ncbi:WD40-repeat-containing domain protein [Cladochytrium replicatum]|nr:WD40-repeat-containing domain protein [Cladochytrium replicatum]
MHVTMSSSSKLALEKRKEEIEKKKQRLLEIKQQREERQSSFAVTKGRFSSENVSSISLPRVKDRGDVDELLKALGVGDGSSSSSPASKSRSLSVASEPAYSSSTSSQGGDGQPVTMSLQSLDGLTPTASMFALDRPPAKSGPSLSIADFVTVLDLAPKEKEYYSKEAQTDFIPEEEVIPLTEVHTSTSPEKAPPVDNESSDIVDIEDSTGIPPEPIRELAEEEKRQLLQSEEFVQFISQSSKRIERLLNQRYDFMVDYTATEDFVADPNAGRTAKQLFHFFDERLLKNRAVTDVDWSSKYPELALGAYNKSSFAVNEPDGLVLVWNVNMIERPEFTFHAQSDVMTAMFSSFHPNLIIGGTYSGQICVWDTRAKSIPVSKTPLSVTGHTHPVYSMNMVGTQNAHYLISASTDGLVCSWQLNQLTQPQEVLELIQPSHAKTDEIAITCFGFPSTESTTFWVGTEEGNVYQANRHMGAGSKAGINPFDSYKGHYGMVTGLHFHPMSDLFLTSSVDWTVKLWRAKSKPSAAPTQILPLASFDESDDYVYDVKWSPTHPALFGAVNGSGKFDLYQLNQEFEVPVVSVNVGNGRPLNRLEWDRDGKRTAIGSVDGHIYVHDIGEMAVPHNEEWLSLQKSLQQMDALGL